MIRVLQHHTPNFKPLIDISRPIHEEYCRLHGYSLHIKEVPEYGVYNGLEKLNQILEVCEDGDSALVMDADAMVTNLLLKVERFLEYGKGFYLSEGKNMGVFIFYKSVLSSLILRGMIDNIKNALFNCEQDAMEYEASNLLSEGIIKILPHPCFNSFLPKLYWDIKEPVQNMPSAWETGHFICHVPAQSIETRIKVLNDLKEKIVR